MKKFYKSMTISLLRSMTAVLMVLSMISTPLMKVSAISFDDTFRQFGEHLQDWQTIQQIAGYETVADIPTSNMTIWVTYHDESGPVVKEVKIGSSHLALADEIVTNFTENLWNEFCSQAGANPALNNASGTSTPSKIKVDISSKKVERNASAGCTKTEFSNIKASFAEVTGSTSINGWVYDMFGGLSESLTGNEFTDEFSAKVNLFAGTLIYIVITITSVIFILITVCDIAFLLIPFFRRFLLSFDEDGGYSKVKGRILTFLISEAAVNAVGRVKNGSGAPGTMNGMNYVDQDRLMAEPDWGYWLKRRLVLIVVLLAYTVLLMAGLLPVLVALVTGWIVKILEIVLNITLG